MKLPPFDQRELDGTSPAWGAFAQTWSGEADPVPTLSCAEILTFGLSVEESFPTAFPVVVCLKARLRSRRHHPRMTWARPDFRAAALRFVTAL